MSRDPAPSRIEVHSRQGNYPVLLHGPAGAWLAGEVLAACPGAQVALISDAQVMPLHGQALAAQLEAGGRQVLRHVLPVGEQSKSLEAAAAAYDACLTAGLGRGDAVVALGGGVVGDLAGFVAATYLRGLRCVQIPTTTLAALDASVGGKTAVNTPRGKNLVGTFSAPRAVCVCTQLLTTQSRRAHAAGLVEAAKIATTHDAGLFARLGAEAEALLTCADRSLRPVLARAIALKAEVVGRDELESGERAVLNFGHTVGHALETGSGYRLLHGEAVALGMLAELAWAVQLGLSPQQLLLDLQQLLAALEAPTQWRTARLDRAAMGLDKKRQGADLLLPVVPALGHWQLATVPMAQLLDFLAPASGPP